MQHPRQTGAHMPLDFYQVSTKADTLVNILFSTTPRLSRACKGWKTLPDHQCTCCACQLFAAHGLSTGPQHKSDEVKAILTHNTSKLLKIFALELVFCHRTVLSSLGCCSLHRCLQRILHTNTSRSTQVVWKMVKRNYMTVRSLVCICWEHRRKP